MAVPTALTGRVAPPGLWISGGLLLVGLCLVPWSLGGATAVAVGAGANLLFFRNPRRVPPAGVENILSPADGRVVEVARLQDPGGFVGAAQRVAIFLSIFNAHVQRVPLSAKVRAVRKRGTRFLAAFNPGA